MKMCLTRITKKRLNLKGCGYKVLKNSYLGDGFQTPCCGTIFTLNENTWLDEKDWRENDFNMICIDDCQSSSRSYRKGWHIFSSRRGAEAWREHTVVCSNCVVKKVEYKKGHTVGEQECSLTPKRHR